MYVCFYDAIRYGLGEHTYLLPDQTLSTITKYMQAETQLWKWCLASVKISVATIMLRFLDARPARWALHALRIFLVCLSIAVLFVDMFNCIPPKAIWDFSYSVSQKHANSPPMLSLRRNPRLSQMMSCLE